MSKPIFEIVGAKELQAALKPLAPRMARAIFKKAAVKFAGQTRDALRSVEGKASGKLRRATKSKSTRSGGAVVYVDGSITRIGYIHRKGTKKRTSKHGNRGTSPANVRMDQVIQSQSARFLDQVGVLVLTEIKAQVAKQRAK